MEIVRIRLNKNRGWRGLAELLCENSKREIVKKMVFSFSQAVWNDLLKGYIVTQDNDNYYVIHFDNIERLPKPTQQRSVLIKSFNATVIELKKYAKDDPLNVLSEDYTRIYNFRKNKNTHTTSDWNYIGIRVIPSI